MDWQIIDEQGNPAEVTEEQLRGMLRVGYLKRQTLMWGPGMTDWLPAEQVRPDLFPSLHREAAGSPGTVVVVPPVAMPAQTRRTAKRKVAPAAKSGGMMKWVIIVLLVCLGSGIAILIAGKSHLDAKPGAEALASAEQKLKDMKNSGSGETADVTKAATTLSEVASSLRASGITKGSSSFGRGKSGLLRAVAAGLDANDFQTYGVVKGETAVFLVHVPDLRKFTDEAKEAMGRMAWFAGRLAWAELQEPRPARLCVALRGIANYDRIVEGLGTPFEPAEDQELTEDILGTGILRTITGDTECTDRLLELFAKPEKK